MRTANLRYPVLFLMFVAIAFLCSCGEDGPDGPEPDPDCIGPAGGTIAVTDTTSYLDGVSFSVAPGAWQQCWSVYMYYHSTFSTPNFPDGLEGYEGWLTGSVELEIGRGIEAEWIEAPENLEFELTFPLRGLTAEPGEKIMAFRYDEAAGLYRLAVPMRLDEERLTVKGHHYRQLWTWGKVDLADVDFDTYLAPVMEELHGAGGWLEIQAELDRLQAEALAGHRAMTCEALRIVRGSLAAAGEAAADNVRAIQDGLGGRCGTCDATTREFYDELSEYLKPGGGAVRRRFLPRGLAQSAHQDLRDHHVQLHGVLHRATGLRLRVLRGRGEPGLLRPAWSARRLRRRGGADRLGDDLGVHRLPPVSVSPDRHQQGIDHASTSR